MSTRDRWQGRMWQWYAGGVVVAVVLGWIAAAFHAAGRAPIGILPLGVGLALGAILSGIAAILRVAGRSRLIAGAAILALVAVLAEHAWLYQDFHRQWQEARASSAEVAMFRPEAPWSLAEYFSREASPARTALWALDATLITAAAVATVAILQRQPN